MSGYDLVLVLGQSNARGTNDDYEPDGQDARDPRICSFFATGTAEGSIVPAREPLANLEGHPSRGMGPGGPFAALLLPTLPSDRQILIVPAAIGGTGFTAHGTYPALWKESPDDRPVENVFELAVGLVEKALVLTGDSSRVAAVLWHQGESDGNTEQSEQLYAADLDELISRFRSRVPMAADAPFIVGQMAQERLAHNPSHAGVDAAHRATPARMPRTGFAPSPPLGYCREDNTHFSAEGQRRLGASYFDAFLRVTRDSGPGGTRASAPA